MFSTTSGASLFDFVEKEDGGGMESQAVGQQATEPMADIARRRAGPNGDRMGSFRPHLAAMKRNQPAAKKAVSQTPGGIGLARAGGTDRQQTGPRPAVPVGTARLHGAAPNPGTVERIAIEEYRRFGSGRGLGRKGCCAVASRLGQPSCRRLSASSKPRKVPVCAETAR